MINIKIMLGSSMKKRFRALEASSWEGSARPGKCAVFSHGNWGPNTRT